MIHGGKSLAGLANGNYRTGRYSKDLPSQLARRAEEARSDPRLLSLSEDIAVLQALVADRLAGLGHGESAKLWQDLQAARAAFHAATVAGDMAAMKAADAEVERLIQVGGSKAAARAELRRDEETLAKLVQTEVKTLQSLQQMVTVEQLQLHLGAVTNVVVEGAERFLDVAVKRKYLQYVLAEFTKLSTLEERPVRNVTPAQGEEGRR